MRFSRFVKLFLVCLPLLPLEGWAQRSHVAVPKKVAATLPETYRSWLMEDVPYIISEDERNEFLKLKTDLERDKFIESFWESRNPDPHSSINVYKEEHYRRLAYVRANFGDSRYNDGWRSEMGQVYITLGPPKQTAKYHIGISTREVEIWFYQSSTPALPPYFNVVFYKRGAGEPYTLYSPRMDGPRRIVSYDANSDADALLSIRDSMGSEAEHAMVSLLPGEPVNLRDPVYSGDSDRLLDEIRNLPNEKLEKERIAGIRHANSERVTSSVFLAGSGVPALDTAVLRDEHGQPSVHFLLRREVADARLIGTLSDKRTGYDMTMQVRVMTKAGKAVYQQTDTFAAGLSAAAAQTAKGRLFAAEGRLPLPAGEYEVEATLTNGLTHEGTRSRKQVTVPAAAPEGLGISDLVAYALPSPSRDPEGQLPFSLSHLRFTPRGAQTVQVHSGDKLPILYQIWFPAADLAVAGGTKTVHVQYVLGSVADSAGHPPLEEDENVELKNLDAAGNLLTGHTFDTTALHEGTYRLIVRVTEPGVARAASAAMTVRVLPEGAPVALWTAYGDEAQHPAWRDELLRGVADEATGRTVEAAAAYRRALALNAEAGEAQTRLDALTKKVASVPVPAAH